MALRTSKILPDFFRTRWPCASKIFTGFLKPAAWFNTRTRTRIMLNSPTKREYHFDHHMHSTRAWGTPMTADSTPPSNLPSPSDNLYLIHLQALAARELSASLPLNDYGLPTGFYRIDMLPVLSKYMGKKSQQAPVVPQLPNVGEGKDGVLLLPNGEAQVVLELEPGELHRAPTVPPLVDLDSGTTTMDGTMEQSMIDAYMEESARRSELRLRQLESENRIVVNDAPSFAFERRDLIAAWVPLSYLEGFPTLPNGQPFWTKLDYESPTHHLALEAYLQLPTVRAQGIRELSQLPEFLYEMTRAAKSTTPMLELGELQMYYHLYYWHYRVKSYDIYKVASYRRQMEQRAIATQDDHYVMSKQMMERLQQYMESEEDFWQILTPKAAIDLMKTLVSIQRMSVGLPVGGPPTDKTGNPVQSMGNSMEMILRMVAQQQGGAGAQQEEAVRDSQLMLDKILSDPKMLTLAQELVVKINSN